MKEKDVWIEVLSARLQLVQNPVGVGEEDKTKLRVMGDRLYEEQVVAIVQNNPNFFIDRLDDFRSMSEQSGQKLSKPRLLSGYIKYGVGGFAMRKAIDGRQKGINGVFVIWFDFAMGVFTFSDCVIYAEKEISGESDATVSQALDELREGVESVGFRTSLGEEAEAFLKVRPLIEHLGSILKQDPTGFSLADYIVEEMSKPPAESKLVSDQFHGEFVHAGGEFAAKAYKAIYPLLSENQG